MRVIKVRDIYSVTQISKRNDRAWEKLIDTMEEIQEGQDVMLDFEGIELEEPWSNEVFNKLIRDERVHIKVYSSEAIKETVDLACRLGGLKPGRIENEDNIIESTDDELSDGVKRMVQRFADAMITCDDRMLIDVTDIVDQISDENTIKSIELAIRECIEETGNKKYAVNTDSMFIQINIIEVLSRMIGRFRKEGIDVVVMSTDDDVVNKISIYQNLDRIKKLNTADRIRIFKETIELGTVGMISKFKETRRRDEFGRKGDGVPIVCRVCIFRGMEGENVVLETFNGKYFFTRVHYSLDRDGEILQDLPREIYRIPIDDMGLCDKYIGSTYHFSKPIQYDERGSMETYEITEEGSMRRVVLTLPQYIKLVLEDFEVEHDKVSLVNAINETDKYMRKYKDTVK